MGSKPKLRPGKKKGRANSPPPGSKGAKASTSSRGGHKKTPSSGTEPAKRIRRSFSQQNLELHTEGALGERLGAALRVPRESGYVLTHAFHPYPGRFHPNLPREVLAAMGAGAEPKSLRVLDPFMGGGTALVEAMLLGHQALGNDLNPVAVMVARERTRPRTPAQAHRVNADARRIAGQVEELRREKHPPRASLAHQQRLAPHYQRHLLAEMMQWPRLIGQMDAGAEQETLRAVFSSAAVKFSNLASDSRQETPRPPTYPKGAVSRFLVEKCAELTRAQSVLLPRIPPRTPPARLLQEDARLLSSLADGEVELVLTSPPYPGTYDYHHQHLLRMDWLELDGSALLENEMGARRDASTDEAMGGWSRDLRAVLGTLARVLRPGGHLFLALGDWISSGHGVDGKTALLRAADAGPWRLAGAASMRRSPHSRHEQRAFAKRGKWEHLLYFVRERPEADQRPPG